MSYRIKFGFLVLIFCFLSSKSEKCSKLDLEFQYTNCDKTGHRWLVSVPKLNKSCDLNSDFIVPKPARNCGDPCDSGTYLDVESQDCKDCPSGTYSQGNRIEISNWHTMPPGFQTLSLDRSGNECKRDEWIPMGEYISASVSQCQSMLTFTASLYKAGTLKFDYQKPEGNTVFDVTVLHDECLAKGGDKNSIKTVKFMDATSASSWATKEVPLKKGPNVITWTVLDSERSSVKITNVRVKNSIFSSQCTKCPAGYFSSKKSTICSPCSMNTYNDQAGSDHCKDCVANQYALPGSKTCEQKSSCTTTDYSYKWTACNLEKQRKKVYLWIEPKLCSDTAAGSVKLPSDSQYEACEPCPRGTYLNETLQQCLSCGPGTVSAHPGDQCSKCSANTKPTTSILYDKWSHPLPNLTFVCIQGFSKKCKGEETWIFNGDHLQSSLISEIHILQFEFETNDKENGFGSASKSTFAFQFSMHCTGYCMLHLIRQHDKFMNRRVNTWINSTSRMESRHYIPPNTAGKFIWFFTSASESGMAQKSTDYVKIYSIEMSNLKNVGAIDCRNCDPKSMDNGCLDCDKGKYFSKDSRKCESCPKSHILKNYPGKSIDDCVPCGTGLRSNDGSRCVPSLTFVSSWKNIYDLSQLTGFYLLRGNRLFNTYGQEYTYVFNVTLFTERGQPLSSCHSNVTTKANDNNDPLFTDGVTEISSPVCRVTIVADKAENNTLYSIQTISLAETFTKVEQSNTSLDYWRTINDSLSKHGFDGDETGMDLHIYLASDRKTDICTKGRQTIVTIRCDKTLSKIEFLLPPKCPAETCDGCNFHFLLRSPTVCPYCRAEDLTVITEECVGGHQKRHFQVPSYCVLQPGSASTEDIKCPIITMRTAIIVIPTLSLLLFLVGLVVYCYKKNKRLEYKYMRLIGGNEDNEHILTGAESCGMNDGDEDEEDDVKIKTNSKSGKMFARFNKPTRNRKDENDMETVNLNDNPEFDI